MKLELRKELILINKKCDPPKDACKGTLVNLRKIDKKMKKENLLGILIGSCSNKIFKRRDIRKDIDILLLKGEVGRFQWGVDWWIPREKQELPPRKGAWCNHPDDVLLARFANGNGVKLTPKLIIKSTAEQLKDYCGLFYDRNDDLLSILYGNQWQIPDLPLRASCEILM